MDTKGLPDGTQRRFAGLSDEEKHIFSIGLIFWQHQDTVKAILTNLPAQDPNSNPTLDAERLKRLRSAVPDSEKEGVLQSVTELLNKPCEKFLHFLQKSDSRDATTQGRSSHPMAVAWKIIANFPEAILGKYPRTVVPSEDIMPGYPLRGVVKIIADFGGGTVSSGSGVLINEWTVATVGHILINNDGHAKTVGILVGQAGSDHCTESRKGIYVAVHYKWFEKRSDLNDVAFIRLSKPFDTVDPIGYMQTPVIENQHNGRIYGFPYDMPGDAPGDRLCVSNCPIRYSQPCSTGILKHEGDTEKGTSGGPVLDANGTVIALHRGWTYEGLGKINQAVAIDRDSNDFWAFCQILEYMSQRENARVKLVGKVEKVGGFAFAW
ncbi:trypsin-like cysteine/serine peptidase domain-containing protein [Xylaria sp. FL1042]|nr:trypsin-like cysteine/serine peptidase domain-containing protein [Xylaria sp. FL1042]